MRKRVIAVLFLSLLFQPFAFADRVLPASAKRATLAGHQYPKVKLDKTTYRLSPGAKIFDQSNRSILPNYLPQSGQVLYQTDARGDLSALWVLTPKEQADWTQLERTKRQ